VKSNIELKAGEETQASFSPELAGAVVLRPTTHMLLYREQIESAQLFDKDGKEIAFTWEGDCVHATLKNITVHSIPSAATRLKVKLAGYKMLEFEIEPDKFAELTFKPEKEQ
jgi:hypothetical protein